MLRGLGHRAAVADGRQHVVQRRPLGHVIMHVAGRHQRNPRLPRDLLQPLQFSPIVRPAVQFGQQIAAVGEQVAVGGRSGRGEQWSSGRQIVLGGTRLALSV